MNYLGFYDGIKIFDFFLNSRPIRECYVAPNPKYHHIAMWMSKSVYRIIKNSFQTHGIIATLHLKPTLHSSRRVQICNIYRWNENKERMDKLFVTYCHFILPLALTLDWLNVVEHATSSSIKLRKGSIFCLPLVLRR